MNFCVVVYFTNIHKTDKMKIQTLKTIRKQRGDRLDPFSFPKNLNS